MRKQEIGVAPLKLDSNEVISKVLQNRGNSFEVFVPESQLPKVREHIGAESDHLLVGLSPALRNKLFVRRNGFVVVTLENLGPNGKLKGEITDVVSDVREWQRTLSDWPPEFAASRPDAEALDLPPSLSDESEYESDVEDNVEDNVDDNAEDNVEDNVAGNVAGNVEANVAGNVEGNPKV